MGILTRNGTWLLVLASAMAVSIGCRSKLDVKTTGAAPAIDKCPDGTEPPCATIEEPTDTDTSTDTETDTDTSTATEPDPQKKEIKALLKGSKQWFQTRDEIAFTVPDMMFKDATKITIMRKRNPGESKKNAVILHEEEIDGDGLDNGFRAGSALMISKAGIDRIFTFYPDTPQTPAGRRRGDLFVYAGADAKKPIPNYLEVHIEHVKEKRWAERTIYLKDFPIFGVAITSFASNVQVAEVKDASDKTVGYYQGWVNVLSPAAVEHRTDPAKPETVTSKLTHGFHNIVNDVPAPD